MKIHANTVDKINVTLVDNSHFEDRSKLSNDIGIRITNTFHKAYTDGIITKRITGIDILKKLDGKIEVKLEPQELQKYLKITWIKI